MRISLVEYLCGNHAHDMLHEWNSEDRFRHGKSEGKFRRSGGLHLPFAANGCCESWNNGMVEGFVNKVKWIKRSSYGQAGFPLLQRRVLLHLDARESLGKDQRRRSSQRPAPAEHQDASSTWFTPTALAEVSGA